MDDKSKILKKDKFNKKTPVFLIILLAVYCIYCFAILYVKVTMNHVIDPEIIEFTEPFDLALIFTFILWGAMVVLGVLTNRKTIKIIRKIAWINICVAIFVACLYMLPCMFGNPEILGLKEKLLKLLMCPSYNLTSWVNVFAVVGISLLLLMSSSMGKRVLRREKLRKE